MPVESVKHAKGLVVNMIGSFDRQASDDLCEAINDQAKDKKKVVINLDDVSYISSVSIGTLIKLHRELQQDDKKLSLACVSDECKKVFDMVEVDKIMDVYNDVEEALK